MGCAAVRSCSSGSTRFRRWKRAFLPGLPAVRFVTAHAACGGYPLHTIDDVYLAFC